jgi:hypothetical protein
MAVGGVGREGEVEPRDAELGSGDRALGQPLSGRVEDGERDLLAGLWLKIHGIERQRAQVDRLSGPVGGLVGAEEQFIVPRDDDGVHDLIRAAGRGCLDDQAGLPLQVFGHGEGDLGRAVGVRAAGVDDAGQPWRASDSHSDVRARHGPGLTCGRVW